ncbi:RcnB family protein [Terricaulis sp.]|uniref:RcnB family protein n=1 Tax=Terricaulis sp. TaxID=2768686 RepID=UPI003784FCE1
MKRLAIAATALLTMIGPLAATSAAADPPRSHRVQQQQQQQQRFQQQRWDDSRYNGFYVGNRFYRGQPNAAQQRARDFRPAWQQWRRGERLNAYQRAHYRRVDFRREHLRAPPRGYEYRRDERGDLLMVAIATGLIASIIASN